MEYIINAKDPLATELGLMECQKVVRCRDCEHYDSYDGGRCYSEQWSTASLMPSHRVTPDGFCAWGIAASDFACSECGCSVYGGDELGVNITDGSWNYCPNCGAKVVD